MSNHFKRIFFFLKHQQQLALLFFWSIQPINADIFKQKDRLGHQKMVKNKAGLFYFAALQRTLRSVLGGVGQNPLVLVKALMNSHLGRTELAVKRGRGNPKSK